MRRNACVKREKKNRKHSYSKAYLFLSCLPVQMTEEKNRRRERREKKRVHNLYKKLRIRNGGGFDELMSYSDDIPLWRKKKESV